MSIPICINIVTQKENYYVWPSKGHYSLYPIKVFTKVKVDDFIAPNTLTLSMWIYLSSSNFFKNILQVQIFTELTITYKIL